MLRHVVRRKFAAAVLIAGLAAPATAQAMPDVAPLTFHPAPVEPGPTSVTPSGFPWDDAGIGAAGATLLLAVGATAAVTARRRRTSLG